MQKGIPTLPCECGNVYAVYQDTPTRFEDTEPEAARILMEACGDKEIRMQYAKKELCLPPGERMFRSYGEKSEPIRSEGKIGRNDPCPCGSGKKFKKCCG